MISVNSSVSTKLENDELAPKNDKMLTDDEFSICVSSNEHYHRFLPHFQLLFCDVCVTRKISFAFDFSSHQCFSFVLLVNRHSDNFLLVI